MKEEIEIAVKWWLEQFNIRNKHNTGESFSSALANYVDSKQPPVTDEQKKEFGEVLTCLLPDYLKASNWDEAIAKDKKDIGSALRTLSTDYDACGILRAAAQTAGINYCSTIFPQKTVMWINPGEVKVSKGYGANIEYIYKKNGN